MALSMLEKLKIATEANKRGLELMRNPDYGAASNTESKELREKALAASKKDRLGSWDVDAGGTCSGFGLFLQDVASWGMTGRTPESFQTYENQYKEFREKSLKEYRGKNFPSGALNESIMSDGGVFVPPQYANELLMRIYEHEILKRVRSFNQLTSNILRIPAIDETSRADGSRFGGVQSYMRQEGPPSALTTSKSKESYIDLKVETLYVFQTVTTELLEDYPALETFNSDIVAQEFQFKLEDLCYNGDGVGKPLGMVNSPSLLSVAKDAGQSAAAGTGLLADNIFAMWAAMYARGRQNSIWIGSNTLWPQLLQMTVGSIPIFIPQHSINGSPFSTLLGRPFIESEVTPVLGVVGDIMLVDPSTYLFATKGDLSSFSSMHVYFDKGLHAFKYEMRIDGKSWWKSPLSLKYGTNKVSNIVTMAARP